MSHERAVLQLKCFHLREATAGISHFASSSYSEFDACVYGGTWELGNVREFGRNGIVTTLPSQQVTVSHHTAHAFARPSLTFENWLLQ